MLVTAPIGSVSSGTMRPEDLIPAFLDALNDIRERAAAPRSTLETGAQTMERSEVASRLDDIMADIERRMYAPSIDDTPEYWGSDSEEPMYDMETLTDLLSEFAPPFCYFGAHEGDDYGFWLSWEAIEEAEHNGTLFRIEAGHDWRVNPSFNDELSERWDAGVLEHVLEVNDHGNCTLYGRDHGGEFVVLWDCV